MDTHRHIYRMYFYSCRPNTIGNVVLVIQIEGKWWTLWIL